MEALLELFEFWTKDQLRTVIKNCEKKGLIVKGNYNKIAYDRTIWYALTPLALDIYDMGKFPNAEQSSWEKSQMEKGEIPNGNGKIPHLYQIINQIINQIKIMMMIKGELLL